VAGVAALLLLLALQAFVSVRRDRRLAQVEDGEPRSTAGQPAYVEDLELREQNLPPERP
jgi:hypothetical protein